MTDPAGVRATLRATPGFDPSATGPAQSYSTRPRGETPGQVVANRVGVTATLFSIAMGSAYLLGRPRR